MKNLEGDKHNQPMFSVAAKKLSEKLAELFEKHKEERAERTPSQLDSSLSSINTSFFNRTVIKGSKASLGSV
jgi:predicted restriction endonuclease